MEKKVLYFAYGSNMNANRMTARLGECQDLGKARLFDWHFMYNAGKMPVSNFPRFFGNVVPVKGATTWGVLYKIDHDQLWMLDHFEKVNNGERGYDRRTLRVYQNHQFLSAAVYVARPGYRYNERGPLDPVYQPTPEYMYHCIEGAVQHHIDARYIRKRLCASENVVPQTNLAKNK